MKIFSGGFIVMTIVATGFLGLLADVKAAPDECQIESPEEMLVDGAELYAPPTISRETTFLTEPVNERGLVDYLAALNLRVRKGVTFENNAAVLFVKAKIGWSDLDSPMWEQYCETLGLELSDLMEPGFQQLGELTEQEKVDLEDAMTKPWSAAQYPELAEWVNVNEAALELIIEGTYRSECYLPLIPDQDDNRLMNIRLPAHHDIRGVTRCLVARAMLRLGEGKPREAEQDLLAAHRLSRLMGKTPFLICGLVAYAVDRIAGAGDNALLQYGKLSATEALAYQRELRTLPRLPLMIDHFDSTERLSILNAVTTMEDSVFDRQFLVESDDAKAELTEKLRTGHDEYLRVCNERFDEFVEAGRLPTFVERRDAMASLGEGLRQTLRDAGFTEDADDLNDPDATKNRLDRLREELQGEPPIEVGRRIGSILVALLMPYIDGSTEAEMRGTMRDEMLQIGFALEAYRADQMKYPQTLDLLVPNYISKIPRDLYNDQALRFVSEADGYLLYSVGANGIADQGRTFDSEPAGDDIVLRIDAELRRK